MPKRFLLQELRKAALNRNKFALFEMAVSMEFADDGVHDIDEAVRLYADASALGHAGAENSLLLLHVQRQATVIPEEEVFRRLLAHANAGDIDAQCNVGLCYQEGTGVEQDYERSERWYRKAAESGSSTGQFNLGGLYYEGLGRTKNIEMAISWYTKAAEQRHELALIQLGSMYERGIGLEQDPVQALILFTVAHRGGSTRAANHLGSLFRRGLGVERDLEFAYQLYLESVSRPDTSDSKNGLSYRIHAYYWLGHMCEHGEGRSKNLTEAMSWYRQGKDLGDKSCSQAVSRLKGRRTHSRKVVSQ